MDAIKTKIEVGGVILESFQTHTAHGCHISTYDRSRNVYRDDMSVFPIKEDHLVVGDPVFFIESDDPGKLHKFTGMKYEGLVDRPKDVFKVIEEFAKKFEGCTIVYSANQVAIHGKRLHSIRGKSILFRSLATTTGEEFVGGMRVCRISHPHLEDVNLSHVKKNASEIISEFTRIMKDEDNA